MEEKREEKNWDGAYYSIMFYANQIGEKMRENFTTYH